MSNALRHLPERGLSGTAQSSPRDSAHDHGTISELLSRFVIHRENNAANTLVIVKSSLSSSLSSKGMREEMFIGIQGELREADAFFPRPLMLLLRPEAGIQMLANIRVSRV